MKLILIMALTADGKIGKTPNHFPDWTEPADKKLFMSISRDAGVLIMGARTFDTLGKPLPGRKHVVMTRNKARHAATDDRLVFTDAPPREILEGLESQGYRSAVLAGGAQTNLLFARQKLIDELVLTYSPKIFGTGLSIFSEPVDMDLELVEHGRIGEGTLKIRYRVKKQGAS